MLKQFDKTICKLSKTYSIPPLEWEDIAQELRIHLYLKEKAAKEPIKSYDDWAYIVCRNKIRNLARDYKRNNRDSSKFDSIEQLKEKGIEIEG